MLCFSRIIVSGLFPVFMGGVLLTGNGTYGQEVPRSSDLNTTSRPVTVQVHTPAPPKMPTPPGGKIDNLKFLSVLPHAPWESMVRTALDKAISCFSGNKTDLLSGNRPELFSENKTDLLSGNNPKLLSENNPQLLSGNRPTILSGNQTPILSNNRISLFSNLKIEIHIENSGNNNNTPSPPIRHQPVLPVQENLPK